MRGMTATASMLRQAALQVLGNTDVTPALISFKDVDRDHSGAGDET